VNHVWEAADFPAIKLFEITNDVNDNGARPLGSAIRGLTIPYQQ
jgi:hypothetical protein